jgi:hypothetical protein
MPKLKRWAISVWLALGLISLTASVMAQVVNSGNVQLWGQLTAPFDLRADGFEDNDWAYLFTEHVGLTLSQNETVDAVAPGLYDAIADLGTFTISAGTVVNVYLLHSDPRGNGPKDYSGSITFPGQILGVIARGPRLLQSDPRLGVSGVQYSQSGTYRGYELDTQSVEEFEILSDRKTLRFYCRTTSTVDDLRIITLVPEPASLSVLGAGIAALLFKRRRRTTAR